MSKSFTARFITAMTNRNADLISAESPAGSADILTAIANAERSTVALDQLMSEPAFAEVSRDLLKRARIAHASEDKLNYIAVKVLVKIISTMQAMVTGKSALDPYTRTIGANLCKLNGISNKSNLVALSKSIEYDAIDQTQSLRTRYNCSPGTASSQSGSTRMTLKYLGIADVAKGKRGDVMTLSDNDRAKRFVSIFDEKTIAEEQQPVEAVAA